MSTFSLFVGIDYSGAMAPTSRLKGLQVFAAKPGAEAESVPTPAIAQTLAKGGLALRSIPRYWTRSEIALWIVNLIKDGRPALIGIDHGFSFPDSYFKRYGLKSWDEFLADFCRHWPTDRDHTYVDFVRDGFLARRGEAPPPGSRTGRATEFRLCERWTSSAKSVFQFDVQGAVAKSTHAGIPWLRRIRESCGDAVHFWPFDGWSPPAGKTVIAEVYPSIFRNRYDKQDRSADAHDAYAVARWLAESAARGSLERYFNPPLTIEERRVVEREGWILGVT
jgi:hypothetical protein